MPVNKAEWAEGTNIVLDIDVEAPAAGWALNYVSVNRIGDLVAAHIEATYANGAAAPVVVLAPEFAPGDVITSPDGKFTIAADGTVSFTGSTAASAKVICDVVYGAGLQSPG